MTVTDIAMAVTNGVMAAIPRPMPEREKLEQSRIVSHRGEYDNRKTKENTLDAFRHAQEAGVWGIECDIRWTSDLVPVICHDPSAFRVFGKALNIAGYTFEDLRKILPEIPTLWEVVDEFGGNTHLMLELKADSWHDKSGQVENLKNALSTLQHKEDYHLLSLDTEVYQHIDFAPSNCFLPVAETNVSAISQFALENDCAGFAGHYLLMNQRTTMHHQASGQMIGTGFPTSENCFRREINRGVELIFSNHAVKLERLRQTYLERL